VYCIRSAYTTHSFLQLVISLGMYRRSSVRHLGSASGRYSFCQINLLRYAQEEAKWKVMTRTWKQPMSLKSWTTLHVPKSVVGQKRLLSKNREGHRKQIWHSLSASDLRTGNIILSRYIRNIAASKFFLFWSWQRPSVGRDWKSATLQNSAANSAWNEECVFTGIEITK
jgi:hypothetical protein